MFQCQVQLRKSLISCQFGRLASTIEVIKLALWQFMTITLCGAINIYSNAGWLSSHADRRRKNAVIAGAVTLLLHTLAICWWLRSGHLNNLSFVQRGNAIQVELLPLPSQQIPFTRLMPLQNTTTLPEQQPIPINAPVSNNAIEVIEESKPNIKPLSISPEALAESINRERRWQEKQPRVPNLDGRFISSRDEPSLSVLIQEIKRADGSRLEKIKGPLGTYCVTIPPPDSRFAEGPGPRLALPTNSP